MNGVCNCRTLACLCLHAGASIRISNLQLSLRAIRLANAANQADGQLITQLHPAQLLWPAFATERTGTILLTNVIIHLPVAAWSLLSTAACSVEDGKLWGQVTVRRTRVASCIVLIAQVIATVWSVIATVTMTVSCDCIMCLGCIPCLLWSVCTTYQSGA